MIKCHVSSFRFPQKINNVVVIFLFWIFVLANILLNKLTNQNVAELCLVENICSLIIENENKEGGGRILKPLSPYYNITVVLS